MCQSSRVSLVVSLVTGARGSGRPLGELFALRSMFVFRVAAVVLLFVLCLCLCWRCCLLRCGRSFIGSCTDSPRPPH